jgi:hypothetical protein
VVVEGEGALVVVEEVEYVRGEIGGSYDAPNMGEFQRIFDTFTKPEELGKEAEEEEEKEGMVEAVLY